MNKPTKPNITIPESFAANGVKADFDNNKILNGFDKIQPDVLAGDNLNKFIDDTYKGLNYSMVASDALNILEDGHTLVYKDGEIQSQLVQGLDGKITNCITEIPQRIKLELNNGTLTLKAGSKVIVPNGAGVFDEVEIATDTSRTRITANVQNMLFINSGLALLNCDVKQVFSGSTAPTGYSVMWWYDTTNNLVKYTTDGGATWVSENYLPVGIATGNATGDIISIDQVFNGFGYIGSTVWVDKGVKGLVPNGRNEDGTLRNTEITTQNVLTQTASNTNNFKLIFTGVSVAGSSILDYSEKDNLNINVNDGSTVAAVIGGTFTRTAGVVSNFRPKQPFRAVDYNDFQNTPHIVSTYVNGTSWYRIWSDGWIEQGGYYTHNNTATVITVTLLKSFSNTNYNLQKLNKSGSSAASSIAEYGYVAYETKNTGSFTCKMTDSNRYAGFDWYACGY